MAGENNQQNNQGGQGGNEPDGSGQQNQQQQAAGNGSQQQGNEGNNSEINDPDAKAKADAEYRFRRKNEDLQNQLNSVTPELEELRKFKQELEDRDKTDLQKAEQAAQQATQERDALKVQVEDLQLKVGILTAPDAEKFHNPLAALRFVPDYKPELGQDGKVTNLGDILGAVAKDHPYLLKPSSGAEEGENGSNNGANGEGSSGASPSGSPFNKKSGSSTPDRDYLEQKFPSLRGR